MEQLNQRLNALKIPLVLSFIGIILIIGGLYLSTPSKLAKNYPEKSIISSTNQAKLIKVDISGAVLNSGVYQLPLEARVEDAVKQAGGFRQDVNKEYVLKKLNLSQKLIDGTKIYIPFKGELTNTQSVLSTSTNSSTSLIGVNSATQSQLEALPGIGPTTATKIIDKRPFSSLEELYMKKAISKTLFEKIKSQIDLN